MHSCAVIIHTKGMGVREVREIVGDDLVDRAIADWYSSDDYRERKIDGKVTVPFEEFLKLDGFGVNNELHYYVVSEDGIDYVEIFKDFWDIYKDVDYNRIVSLYKDAKTRRVNKMLNDLKEEGEGKYEVTLLDYHH